MTTIDIFIPLILHYWWLALLIIAMPILKLFAPTIKGKFGEFYVNLATKLRLESGIYHLIKDVTLPSKNGTTQIDHIIISKFGIFVIETKNYKGWIFADAKSRQWTQVNFKQKHRFQNPLRQNYAHICALSELLELPKEKIQGIICFVGDAKFKTDIPSGVFFHGRYIDHIKSFHTELFSEKEIFTFINKIETGRLKRGFKTNQSHVRQINKTQYPLIPHEKICPKCGSVMVKRTAKKGAHFGNKFWGCSRYPSCRSTQPIAD